MGGLSDMPLVAAGCLLTAGAAAAWRAANSSSSSKDLLQQEPQHPACLLLVVLPEPYDSADRVSARVYYHQVVTLARDVEPTREAVHVQRLCACDTYSQKR